MLALRPGERAEVGHRAVVPYESMLVPVPGTASPDDLAAVVEGYCLAAVAEGKAEVTYPAVPPQAGMGQICAAPPRTTRQPH